MKRFLASAWFPFLTCLLMAGVTTAAFVLLKPSTTGIGSEFLLPLTIGSWAQGAVIGLLSFVVICILNLIRRIVRLRRSAVLHPLVTLAGIVPWVIFSWRILDEPRWTPFAGVVLDFFARPMLWGSLAASLFVIICSIPLLFSSKK